MAVGRSSMAAGQVYMAVGGEWVWWVHGSRCGEWRIESIPWIYIIGYFTQMKICPLALPQ